MEVEENDDFWKKKTTKTSMLDSYLKALKKRKNA